MRPLHFARVPGPRHSPHPFHTKIKHCLMEFRVFSSAIAISSRAPLPTHGVKNQSRPLPRPGITSGRINFSTPRLHCFWKRSIRTAIFIEFGSSTLSHPASGRLDLWQVICCETRTLTPQLPFSSYLPRRAGVRAGTFATAWTTNLCFTWQWRGFGLQRTPPLRRRHFRYPICLRRDGSSPAALHFDTDRRQLWRHLEIVRRPHS